MDALELLGLLAVIAVLGIPAAIVVLSVSVSRLKRRVAQLEQDVLAQAVRHRAPQPVSTPEAAPLTGAPDEVLPDAVAERPAAPEEPDDGPLETGPWTPSADLPPEVPLNAERPMAARVQRASALGDWLKANWVYAVSALSLALAGIFFVQYGIENGLLPPELRVMAAIAFGGVLIGAGEWVRRRWGDRVDEATAYLPSTFSGAGLVSIFAGIIAARQLYDLIGPTPAFLGLFATALLAIVLGWFYGPFLAAVGLLGATAAPFVVGGESDAPYWLYAYFTLIAAIGLFVDTVRRWAWVSVLAQALGYAGAGLLFLGTGEGPGWFALALVALTFLAISVPARRLMPDHAGAMNVEFLLSRGKDRPIFPTQLAGASVLLTSGLLLILPTYNGTESLLVYLCLAAMAVALTIWSGGARALSDLTLLPASAFLIRLGFEGADNWPLAREFWSQSIYNRAPETSAPMTVTLLLGFAVAITIMAAWTSGSTGRLKPFWAAGAAVVAPLAALVLELFWAPSDVLGAYPWALHVIALAALMVTMAAVFAKADGEDRRRAAYATLSALSLIALALFLITTKAALTVALGALVVVAAALDRRFRLPEMGLFIQAAVIVLSWRLVVDPGLGWAVEDAALWEALLSYGGAAAAMAAAWLLLSGLERRSAMVFLESAFAADVALLANVLITRQLVTADVTVDWVFTHWALTLNALPWLILMLVQLYRLKLGGAMRWLRWTIAVIAAAIGFSGLIAAVFPATPLLDLLVSTQRLVYGPPVVDTLLVAYALPGLLFLFAMPKLGHLDRRIRWTFSGIGVALATLYAALEIRRLWRGDDLSVPGVTQPELYSYTIALMVVGAALLYQAIARRSQTLRRVAMTVIALTIAKVFLIDISGLTGLTRVFSFLALGLSLAGLAFLNRWAAGRQGEAGQQPS